LKILKEIAIMENQWLAKLKLYLNRWDLCATLGKVFISL
jgi:hypothetical protein